MITRVCWLVVYLILNTAFAAAEPPSFTGLGSLPGTLPVSYANAVSADGSVIVGSSGVSQIGPAEFYQAFRWENGVMTGLGYLPSTYPCSGAGAVSSDGMTIVGTSSSNDFGLGDWSQAFRWQNGAMQGLGLLPGQTPNAYLATGVSDDGLRVVGWGETASASYYAFIWQDGAMAYLLPRGNTAARAISPDGTYVVGDAADQAFRWHDGVAIGLGFLGGNDGTSYATSISADGSVVVGASTSESAAFYEAFRWQDGLMVGLGDLPGGDIWSEATSISADGSTIVGWGTTDSGHEAFVWDALFGMRNLRDVLVNDLGLDLAGWTLVRASDVSADGSVIVGWAVNAQGNIEGFRAVIPEPGSLGALALVFAGIRRRR